MGYTTTFDGEVTVTPPLSAEEADFLRRFSDTRHCRCQPHPYVADGRLDCPPLSRTRGCISHGTDVPGYWCDWVASGENPDGTFSGIKWNGNEKFYDAEAWMQFLIDHFLKPDALIGRTLIPIINGVGVTDAHRVFLTGHDVHGIIEAQGEDTGDHWWLIVDHNQVRIEEVRQPSFSATTPTIVQGHVIRGELEA